MKIVPINKTAQFRGLWQEQKTVVDTDTNFIHSKSLNHYYPFKDETEQSIRAALESKKLKWLVPSVNNFVYEVIISESKLGEKLKFSEAEFKLYKSIDKSGLSDSLKNLIEKDLLSNNLDKYINNSRFKFLKNIVQKIKLI